MEQGGLREDGYQGTWDRWFQTKGFSDEKSSGRAVGEHQEFHCHYDEIKQYLHPYAVAALAQPPQRGIDMVDVGCGTSSIAHAMGNDSYITAALQSQSSRRKCHFVNLLLDISRIALLNHRLLADPAGADGATEIIYSGVQLDCRTLPFPDDTVSLVIDKGTLDALHEDSDKQKMLLESIRVIRPTGFVITVSFATPARVAFLKEFCRGAGIPAPRMWVIGKDPLGKLRNDACRIKEAGAMNYFVSVLAKTSEGFEGIENAQDDFSRGLLARIERSGSLYHEGDSDDEEILCEGLLTDEIL